MSGPHLLNLPPPPSDTPSDFGPGTPNSGISQLSTVAIKEGERGKFRPYGHTHNVSSTSNSSTNTLDAERADRISRLAGLERVATLRGTHQHIAQSGNQNQQQQLGYFDNATNLYKSTVGSASATGSVGGSAPESVDADDGVSSAGLSDDGNASLVGFGEAASSNRSAPISNSGRALGVAGLATNKQHRQRSERSDCPIDGVEDHSTNIGDVSAADLHAMNTTPRGKVDGTSFNSMGGQEQAERIIGETMHDIEGKGLESPVQGKNLGKFSFEKKQ